MSYWSEWALMGLPESTNKTHREKEKKTFNFFFLWCFSCLFPLVRALRAQFEEDAETCRGASAQVQIRSVKLWPRMGFARGYKGSFCISVALTSQNSQQFVWRVWFLLTQSLDHIISSINLSASTIKPLGHSVAVQLFHNLNPLVAAIPVFFPAYMY